MKHFPSMLRTIKLSEIKVILQNKKVNKSSRIWSYKKYRLSVSLKNGSYKKRKKWLFDEFKQEELYHEDYCCRWKSDTYHKGCNISRGGGEGGFVNNKETSPSFIPFNWADFLCEEWMLFVSAILLFLLLM